MRYQNLSSSAPIVIGLLATCIGCTPTEPTEFDAGTTTQLRIAYNVYTNNPEGNYDVFVMDLDGKNARNLTNTPGVDWVYAAHKDRIFFVSDRDTCHRCYFLYEMDADGNNLRKVSERRVQDSWITTRMNGAELLVDPQGIRDTAFFRIDRAGNVLDTLYHGLPYANDPCFSPDGQRIVLRGAKGKINKDSGFHDELFVMNADGSGATQLTNYPEGDTTVQWWHYHAGAPFWEPNSDRITFQRFQNGNHSIFSIKPDGTDEQQLTPDGFDEGWHTWSPDGKFLVYDGSPVVKGDERPLYDIYLMDVASKVVTRITTDTLTEQAPVFVHAPVRM